MFKFDDKKFEDIKAFLLKIIRWTCIPLFYPAGILAQIFAGTQKYDFISGTTKSAIIINPFGIIGFTFTHLFEFIFAYIVCIILACMVALHFRGKYKPISNNTKDDKRNFEYSDKDTYGTSKFMDEEELNITLNKYADVNETTETILGTDDEGSVLTIPHDTKMNKHIAIFGASGRGKSAAFARSYMIQGIKRGESFVITDPKGELFESMSGYFRDNGYDVKVLNLVNLDHSDSWNCLSEIGESDLKAQIFTDIIMQNTSGGSNGDFWSLCEMNLLKALCLYVCLNPQLETSMATVYTLLTTKSSAELDAMFDALENNERNFAAISAYNIFKNASDNIKGGVIIGIGSRLQVFQGNIVRKITTPKEIDITKPGHTKCAYFCITSDQHSALDFLAVLFYSMLFVKLVEYADLQDGCKLPIPVNFLLDEFPNIGAIPDFTKKISTVRSRDINIAVIFQNIAQLQNRYPYGQWEEILGNCSTHIFLGCDDDTTAKYISNRTGVATVALSTKATSTSVNSIGHDFDVKENSAIGKRALYTPDEVLRIGLDDELLFFSGHNPLRAKKYWYYHHPEKDKLRKCSVASYIPKWKQEEDNMRLETQRILLDSKTVDSPFDKAEDASDEMALETTKSPPLVAVAKPGKKPKL